MALNEAECQKCQVELGKLKAQYEGAGDVPDVAQARIGELEAALGRECSSSDDSSDAGVALVVAGLAGLTGLALLAALSRSRQ